MIDFPFCGLSQSVVAFYYMWKTTDHYLQQKRSKVLEAERKLKQVYIPNYNKPNQTVLFPTTDIFREDVCEAGCGSTSSPQWYALGPPLAPIKVCVNCWTYWKRYGDLKLRECASTFGSFMNQEYTFQANMSRR